jgi:hypothetical protein
MEGWDYKYSNYLETYSGGYSDSGVRLPAGGRESVSQLRAYGDGPPLALVFGDGHRLLPYVYTYQLRAESLHDGAIIFAFVGFLLDGDFHLDRVAGQTIFVTPRK